MFPGRPMIAARPIRLMTATPVLLTSSRRMSSIGTSSSLTPSPSVMMDPVDSSGSRSDRVSGAVPGAGSDRLPESTFYTDEGTVTLAKRRDRKSHE